MKQQKICKGLFHNFQQVEHFLSPQAIRAKGQLLRAHAGNNVQEVRAPKLVLAPGDFFGVPKFELPQGTLLQGDVHASQFFNAR